MAKSWWISAQNRSCSSQNSKKNKTMITKLIGFSFIVAAIVAAIIAIIYFIPIVLIWCINTLFQTTIVVTWTNWFAALVLLMLVGNGSGLSYKKKVKKEGCCKDKEDGGCCKNQ
jgi:hypothetical protein